MSVQQLRSPVVTGWISLASESVTAAEAVPRAALSDGELAAGVAEASVLESRACALKLACWPRRTAGGSPTRRGIRARMRGRRG